MNTRRNFIRTASTGTGALAIGACVTTKGSASNLLELDATSQAQLIQAGQLSPVEILQSTIERIERLNPMINAVVATDFERAMETARIQTEQLANGRQPEGALFGVPYLVKDLAAVSGMPMDQGSRMFSGTIPGEDDPTVAACRAAGMNIIGKTATPEFGLIGSTETVLHGPCSNPWSLEHSPGGSSGGSGAAVAAGMIPIASASDGGGSIRIPASNCGLFGLKPSMGRPRGSVPSLPAGISVKLAESRTVRDSALLLSIYENPGPSAVGMVSEPLQRSLKVGLIIDNHFGNRPHGEVVTAIEQTAKLLTSLGHDVELHRFAIDGARMMDHFMSIWSQGPKKARDQILSQGRDPEKLLEPWTLGLAAMADQRSPDDVQAAVQWISKATSDPAIFGDFDVLLSPVLNTPPALTGEQSPVGPFEPKYQAVLDYVSYTPLSNLAGHAAMSVPLGFSQTGLPIGSHFMARPGDDRLLLELAYQLESAAPWADKWAPNSARFI